MHIIRSLAMACIVVTAPHGIEPLTGTKVEKKLDLKTHFAITQKRNLTFSVMAKDVLVGAPVQIHARVMKKGNERLYFFEIPEHKNYEIEPIDSSGKSVPLTRFGKNQVFKRDSVPKVRRELLEAKTASERIELQRIFDFSIPETYSLIGRRRLFDAAEKPILLELKGPTFKIFERVDGPIDDKKDAKLNINTVTLARVRLIAKLTAESDAATSVSLAMVINNDRNATIHYFEHNGFQVEVTDSKGKDVGHTRFGRTRLAKKEAAMKVRHEIQPGKSRADVIDVGRMFDLSVADRYTVTISLRLYDESDMPILLKAGQLQTNVNETGRKDRPAPAKIPTSGLVCITMVKSKFPQGLTRAIGTLDSESNHSITITIFRIRNTRGTKVIGYVMGLGRMETPVT